MDFVPDASVAIAWAVVAQGSPETDRLREEVEAGLGIVVPSLWKIETANSVLMLKRRKRIRPDECADALKGLQMLELSVDDDGTRLVWTRIAELAESESLTVYDAVYLELAIRRRLPLASRDRALNAAARRRGVKTLL